MEITDNPVLEETPAELDYMPGEYREYGLDFWFRVRGLRRLVHNDTPAAVEGLKRVLHQRSRILGIEFEGGAGAGGDGEGGRCVEQLAL